MTASLIEYDKSHYFRNASIISFVKPEALLEIDTIQVIIMLNKGFVWFIPRKEFKALYIGSLTEKFQPLYLSQVRGSQH